MRTSETFEKASLMRLFFSSLVFSFAAVFFHCLICPISSFFAMYFLLYSELPVFRISAIFLNICQKNDTV